MALLDDVAGYLVAQGISPAGTTGDWSVAKGYEVDTPDRLITLVETGGLPNERPDVGLDRPTFQVRIRGPNFSVQNALSTAMAKATAVKFALDSVGDMRIGPSSRYYAHIRVVHDPLNLGYDNTNRPTYALNCWTARSRTS